MSEERHPEAPTSEEKAVAAREDAQEEQLQAQQRGDTSEELKGFAKEVAADHLKFPSDVAEDMQDPERRVDEEQGTATHPAAEPKP